MHNIAWLASTWSEPAGAQLESVMWRDNAQYCEPYKSLTTLQGQEQLLTYSHITERRVVMFSLLPQSPPQATVNRWVRF